MGKLKGIIRVCSICNEPFQITGNGQISSLKVVCSDPACRKEYNRRWHKQYEEPCLECGQLIFRRYRKPRKNFTGLCRTCHGKYARGPKANGWKGGRIYQGGYVSIRCPEHPRAEKTGYVLEHIKVWEEHHGKRLPENWVIHHLNGIKDDNRIENLLAMPRQEHSARHHSEMCLHAYQKRIKQLEAQVGALLLELRVKGIESGL